MGCTVKTHTNTNFIHNLKAALTPNLLFIGTPHMQTCVSSLHKSEVHECPQKLQCYWQQEKREWVIIPLFYIEESTYRYILTTNSI